MAFSNDESHVWNIVKLNQEYYHIDATWENMPNQEAPTLLYFGHDDEMRRNISGFDGWYTRVNSQQEKQEAPVCGDKFFAPLGDSATAVLNRAAAQIEYTDYLGGEAALDISTFDGLR